MIAIIDYDIGNLSAVANMLHRLGGVCEITSNPEKVQQAEKIILPGNGAFDACMRNLQATGLVPLLESKVLDEKIPILGICVGAQMLGKTSEEGIEPGLGWIDMHVKKFPDLPGLRVPHMGWNNVSPKMRDHLLVRDMDADARFYFVHSYYMSLDDPDTQLLETEYGIRFAAGVAQGKIAGVQFHPEKSHRFGKQLLSRFLEWN